MVVIIFLKYQSLLSHLLFRTVFPPVDQVKVLVPNGIVEIHYNKLKHVDAPEPVEQALGRVFLTFLL